MENQETSNCDVIYVGNLPKPLTESQIKTYFSQFGTVVKIRLMKSKKTGNSRGYCYVQFETPEIASIAAEAMNNYFIDGRVLKVHLKPMKDNVRHLFKKGRPILSRRKRLLLLASSVREGRERAASAVREVLSASGSKSEPDAAAVEGLKARLQTLIRTLETKQKTLNTDVYDAALRKYKRALELLSAPKS
ncbi:nucleolar phosphoprotein [Babesia caballi]|uniref:Nucleolar phosphoprotein n=1 Tax=Babesia caballi TaxID=5871 RepID=A0AAV4M2M1_BABCB|nr:nucleolar phosphoprotein [Babesia caballi]